MRSLALVRIKMRGQVFPASVEIFNHVPGPLCVMPVGHTGSTFRTAALRSVFAMGPGELDIFFKRLFALKVPKDTCMD